MMNWKSWRPTWTSYSLTRRKKKTELRNAQEDTATGDTRVIITGATGEGTLGATVTMGEAGVATTGEGALGATMTMGETTRGEGALGATVTMGEAGVAARVTATVEEAEAAAMERNTMVAMVPMGTTSMVGMGTSTVMETSTVVTAMETSTEVTDIVDEKYVVSFQTALRDCTITLMYACVLLEMPVY